MAQCCEMVPSRAIPDSWDTIYHYLEGPDRITVDPYQDPRLDRFSILRALVDIPDLGVEKGQIGGVIEHGAQMPSTKPAWVCSTSLIDRQSTIGEDTYIGPGVTITASRLAPGVRMNGPGFIHRSILNGRHNLSHAYTSIVETVIDGTFICRPGEKGMLAIRRSYMNASADSPTLVGSCRILKSHITGNPQLERSKISYAVIGGHAQLTRANVDRSNIGGYAVIEGTVQDSVVEDHGHVTATGHVTGGAVVNKNMTIDGPLEGDRGPSTGPTSKMGTGQYLASYDEHDNPDAGPPPDLPKGPTLT